MNVRHKSHVKWTLPLLCILALSVFLVACGGYGDTTTTIGGDTWKQAGGTGDYNGQHYKGVLLVDQHPANTGKVYTIILKAKADSYDQVYNNWYKPILDSYQFTY